MATCDVLAPLCEGFVRAEGYTVKEGLASERRGASLCLHWI